MIIVNDGREIEKALKLDKGSVKHLGNFIFKGTKANATVTIYTTPAADELKIIEIKEGL